MSGQKIDINLNNLVYIGINHNVGDLATRQLRQAISSGIDREKICNEIFYNNALAATGFFNPVWQGTKSVQNIQTVANSQITIENLKEIGYNSLDKEGFYRKNGGALRFSLLVNKENRIRAAAAYAIAEQLKNVGIKITVVEESYENYLLRLQNGDFQLFLAEVNLTDNMDIRPLVISGGALAYGIPANTEQKPIETEGELTNIQENVSCKTVLEKFYGGETAITDVAAVLQTDMPVIPVCYRTGILFCNENIENIKNSSGSDIYFSIESYKFKVN
jgi:peptide/nickel transport system substrate-binding protein